MTKPILTVVTHIPSPYQVELFNAIEGEGEVSIRAVYLQQSSSGRQWAMEKCQHSFLVVAQDLSALKDTALEWVKSSSFVVFNFYSDVRSRKLIAARIATGLPWALWGERPKRERFALFRELRRRVLIGAFLKDQAPIWGIGSWAVEGWRREFGTGRVYCNLPYYSNLKRFENSREVFLDDTCRFLFSGSLIHRKGVDLLGQAFLAVATRNPNAKLSILGAGPLEKHLKARLAGVGRQVEFLGFKPWSELPDVYRRADILVAPSRYDGWGLIVPEALAAGMPVIATDMMGAAIDLIKPGVNGWISKAGCALSLERSMQSYIDLPAVRKRELSEQAHASSQQHSLQIGVEKFVAFAKAGMQSA